MKQILKKILALAICLSIISTNSTINAKDIEEATIADTIEELYEERARLCQNFDENIELIEKIDYELEKLGVVELTEAEVFEKLSIVSPKYSLPSSSSVTWTSTRQTTSYRGESYELQIIRAVPKTSNNELIKTFGGYSGTSAGFTAAAKNVFKIAIPAIGGYIPEVGAAFSAGQTFYDIFKGVISGLTSTSYVGEIQANYTINVVVNYMYVFVKYTGYSDTGNQILSYKGNSVNYTVDVALPNPVEVNGSFVSGVSHQQRTDNIYAPFYRSGWVDRASYNFWEKKHNSVDKTWDYSVKYFNVNTIDTPIRINIPSTNTGL